MLLFCNIIFSSHNREWGGGECKKSKGKRECGEKKHSIHSQRPELKPGTYSVRGGRKVSSCMPWSLLRQVNLSVAIDTCRLNRAIEHETHILGIKDFERFYELRLKRLEC